MTRLYCAAIAATLFVQLAGGSARGEDPAKKSDVSTEKLATGDRQTVDRIMDTAVNNIARRYNLNKPQREKTAEIMNREVYRFLREHEDEVWPLVRDFLARGAWGSPPSEVDEMKRIGKTAAPMMEKIEEAIVRGNEEWRMFLTEEQKVMHDWDMAEIEKTFRQVDKNLDRWAQGDAQAGGIFPSPPPPGEGPEMPPRPPDEVLPEPKITDIFEPNRLFDAFVENFIKQYHLDQSQIDAARSILTEYKGMASDFKNANQSKLAGVGAKWLAAQEAGDRTTLRQAEQERKELLKPVHDMLGEMESRLMALLTTSQKQRFADSAEAAKRRSASAKQVDEPAPNRKKEEPRIKPARGPKKSETNESNDGGGQGGR